MLAASPDGRIVQGTVLKIKCPYTEDTKTFHQPIFHS